jgi:hypothetical protein
MLHFRYIPFMYHIAYNRQGLWSKEMWGGVFVKSRNARVVLSDFTLTPHPNQLTPLHISVLYGAPSIIIMSDLLVSTAHWRGSAVGGGGQLHPTDRPTRLDT